MYMGVIATAKIHSVGYSVIKIGWAVNYLLIYFYYILIYCKNMFK